MESTELIINVLSKADKPLKTSEISKLSNIEQKEVEKIIKKLKIEEKIESPIRCFWIIKP